MPSEGEGAAHMYLDLLKKVLVRWDEDAFIPLEPTGSLPKRLAKGLVRRLLSLQGLEAVRRVRFDAAKRESGRDWPPDADTMVGLKRLDNLQHCIATVLKE
jgi:O-methyltransferase